MEKRHDFTKTDPENLGQVLEDQVQHIVDNAQDKVKESDKTVTVNEGKNGQFRIYNDGTNRYLEFKSGNDWYRSAAFTKVT